jgi:cyclopropane fatty-acyl-phospholipid synthase-like methyltransferase
MKLSIEPDQFINSIQKLAFEAVKYSPTSSLAYQEAKRRTKRPVDYMRCSEFDLVFKQLSLKEGMKVLDISSPQWFSLYLANSYPIIEFHYVNIVKWELDLIQDTAKCLNINNITYHKQDVRSLEFDSSHFDRAISISVIEHVGPEIGGDVQALNEIRRVLTPGGKFTLTMPLKDVRNVIYSDSAVWERKAQTRNFFAREYDFTQFQNLVDETGFKIKEKTFILENRGLLSLDYWEWGPGKEKTYSKWIIKFIKSVEKYLGFSIEGKLAKYYLKYSPEIEYRVVNIAATLES